LKVKLEILEYKELMWELIKRDLKKRYSESFLGFLWYLFEPLILMGVLAFIFTSVFPSGIPNFAIFFLIGFTVYRFFTYGTTMALDSIIINTNLVKTTYLPREIFPITRVIVALISSLFDFIVIFIFMAIFGVAFQRMFLFIPLIFILGFFLTLGAGFILAALFIRWRDLNVIWSLISNILFWILPIVYPLSLIPENYQIFYELNPLALLIQNLRWVMLEGTFPNFFHLLIISIYCVIFLGVGILLFNRRKKTFAEEI